MWSNGAKLLLFVFTFTLVFSVAELFAGVISKSLLLMEESVHMFADSVSFGISLWAEVRTSKDGSQKANLIGSGISLATLTFTMIVVFSESVRRLVHLEDHGIVVNSSIMMGFGVVLCCFHLFCLYLYFMGFSVHSGHGHSHGGSSAVVIDEHGEREIELASPRATDPLTGPVVSAKCHDPEAETMNSVENSACYTSKEEETPICLDGSEIYDVDLSEPMCQSHSHSHHSVQNGSCDSKHVHAHSHGHGHSHSNALESKAESCSHEHSHGQSDECDLGREHVHEHWQIRDQSHSHGHDHIHDRDHDHSHGHGKHGHSKHDHGNHDHGHGNHDHGNHDHGHGKHDHGNHDHGHDHGHSNHDHDHSHSHGHGNHDHDHGHDHDHDHDHGHGGCSGEEMHGHSHDCCGLDHVSLNMASAVFHIFIDFLHSFFVVVTAIVLKQIGDSPITGTIDAIASLCLATIIGGGVMVLGRAFFYQAKAFFARSSGFEVLDKIQLDEPENKEIDLTNI